MAASDENEMKIREDSGAGRSRGRSKKKRVSSFMPRFGCLRLDLDSPTVDEKIDGGGVDMVSAGADRRGDPPTHLIITVNGIIGRADNWRYAAKQFLKSYPQDVIVYCSERNSSSLTFDGVDVMGERLADEVISVIERYPHLCKISFIGHSLGGLIARYAIALLYGRNYFSRLPKVNGETENNGSGESSHEDKYTGKIAGLEPINFITCATPHLSSRGHKQVPLFCGSHTLETVARKASWFLGRSGRHLFLTDNDNGKPPLLFRMVNDCEGLPFMSALQSFKRRVAYSNVCFDQLVGWGTSSLRRENELPKQHLLRNDRYRHIVNVEAAVSPPQKDYTSESTMNGLKNLRTKEMMEVMIMALTALSWERVDVKFGGGKQRLLAHSSIQVQTYCIHSAGADVIQHMIDNFLL